MDTDDGASILLMRRPVKSGDPWSGDMCMPGGRKDPGDNHSFDTVLRETREEIAIDLERDAEFLGRLSDVVTRAHEGAKPMVVTPFVFALKTEATWQLSDEAREIISVPLAF